jgi:N-acetylneuraminic acid mutarotase
MYLRTHVSALQWEPIKPVGTAPSARYSHAAVAMDSAEGMLFIFGGAGSSGVPDPITDIEVWMLDSPAKGWEQIQLQKNKEYVDANCTEVTINTEVPKSRAGHSAVSTGEQSLMCGGYQTQNPSTVFAG